jgi:hypothetical protein
MIDDNNENCDFAPYFFIEKALVVMVARQWQLSARRLLNTTIMKAVK